MNWNHPEQAPTRHHPVLEDTLLAKLLFICLFQDDCNHGIRIQLQSPAAATGLRHVGDASNQWEQRSALRLRVMASELRQQRVRNCVIAPTGCRHRTIVSPPLPHQLLRMQLLRKETTRVFIGGRHNCVDMCSTLWMKRGVHRYIALLLKKKCYNNSTLIVNNSYLHSLRKTKEEFKTQYNCH